MVNIFFFETFICEVSRYISYYNTRNLEMYKVADLLY